MKVALLGSFGAEEAARWRTALARECPLVQWVTDLSDGTLVDAAVVANPPPGSLRGQSRLRLIQSVWAGVDRLLADPTLDPQVPVARMVDPAMSAAMAETALWATLALHRGFFAYGRQQAAHCWQQRPQRRADEVPVLLLGLGAMGREVARRLIAQGYPVSAWRARTGGPAMAGVRTLEGRAALPGALQGAEVVINLLPLTPETRGLVDHEFLASLPPGAAFVNLARGGHVVEDDLLQALDCGRLAQAVLDVFAVEPLPADHRFWSHPRVTVLPHTAAATDERSAAKVVAENLARLQRGEPLLHRVDRGLGY